MKKLRDIWRSMIQFWIPNKGRLTEEQLMRESAYPNGALSLLVLMFVTSLLIGVFYEYSEKGLTIVYIFNVSLYAGILLSLLVWRITGIKWLSINVMLLSFVSLSFGVSFLIGGSGAPSAIFYVIVPVAGIIIGGAKFGVIWAAISIACLFITAYLGMTSDSVSQVIAPDRYGLAMASAFSALIFFVTAIVSVYHSKMIQTQKLLKDKNDQLTHIAAHDPLTQLPNRRYLKERLELLLNNRASEKHRFALLLLDLNGFKPINDNFGHGVGDIILKHVANILTSSLREVDFVCRFGGDEFVIIVQNVKSSTELYFIARKLGDGVKTPVEIRERKHSVTTSIGMAFYPNDGVTYDSLIEVADCAMYRAKQQGKLFEMAS